MTSHWNPHEKNEFEIALTGQITLESDEGQKIIEILQEHCEKEIKTIVEIGTWNGLGSTSCILEAIKGKYVNFWSLECNKEKSETAKEYLQSRLDSRVKLIWGSIVIEDDVYNQDYMKHFPILEEHGIEKRWFVDDLLNCRNAPNVIERLPGTIDFLLLDGGEYTTLYEFKKLFERCSAYIALDDVNVDKCREVREILKADNDWEEVVYVENRHGFSIFKKIKKLRF